MDHGGYAEWTENQTGQKARGQVFRDMQNEGKRERTTCYQRLLGRGWGGGGGPGGGFSGYPGISGCGSQGRQEA